MINTSLDYLLEDALERQGVPVDACLPQGFQSYLSGRQRVLVRLYGTPREPDTLRLTEDERRCVLPTGSESTVAGMLRSEALGPNTLLFIGSDPGDPCFRQMFYDLRGQTSVLRRAYIVLSQSDPEECRYCEGHGLVPVTNTNSSDFLEQLASELKRVGTDVPAEIGWERSREETDGDFESKAWIAAREYARKSLTGGGVAESSSQLEASVVFGSFLRRALSEKGGRQTPETLLLKAREQWSEGDRNGARESFEKAIAGMGGATESDQGDQLLLGQARQDLYHLLVEMGQGQEAAEKYPDIVSRIMPDQYRYREILGPTRVGIAYRVFDPDNQPKTLTLLYRTVGREPGDLDNFVGEVSKVDSGRIRPAKDIVHHGGRAYLVSDDADGKLLRVHLAKLHQEPPPRRPVFEITDQVAEALTVAHALQLPHLDLSPDNIMLDAREQDQGVILGASGAVLVNYRFSDLATRKGGVRTASIEAGAGGAETARYSGTRLSTGGDVAGQVGWRSRRGSRYRGGSFPLQGTQPALPQHRGHAPGNAADRCGLGRNAVACGTFSRGQTCHGRTCVSAPTGAHFSYQGLAGSQVALDGAAFSRGRRDRRVARCCPVWLRRARRVPGPPDPDAVGSHRSNQHDSHRRHQPQCAAGGGATPWAGIPCAQRMGNGCCPRLYSHDLVVCQYRLACGPGHPNHAALLSCPGTI